jgi:hypothetical protein
MRSETLFEVVLDECEAAFRRGDWSDWRRGLDVIDKGIDRLERETDAQVRLAKAVGGLWILYAQHLMKGRTALAAEAATRIAEIEARLTARIN